MHHGSCNRADSLQSDAVLLFVLEWVIPVDEFHEWSEPDRSRVKQCRHAESRDRVDEQLRRDGAPVGSARLSTGRLPDLSHMFVVLFGDFNPNSPCEDVGAPDNLQLKLAADKKAVAIKDALIGTEKRARLALSFGNLGDRERHTGIEGQRKFCVILTAGSAMVALHRWLV